MIMPPPSKIKDFVRRYRLRVTRVAALLLLVLLLVGESAWPKDGFADTLFEMLGILLLGMGAFGRLWASLHISGHKNSQLITDGPYSVMRNPLYVFSFVGALGAGFATESLLIVCLIAILFMLYYSVVVKEEERNLAGRHGKEYEVYLRETPRFIPDFRLFHEAETCTVNVRVYRRALLDAALFIGTFCLLHLLEKMHDVGVLPHLFSIL
jgi:protein-S-isoprenylcysteine O-methyltransferase Ste14